MRRPRRWAARWTASQVCGVGLARADLPADLGVEDLGPAAGQAAQAGLDQLLQDRRHGPPGRSANQAISTAVHAFRCSRGKAACRSRVMPTYQANPSSDARRRRCAARCSRRRPPPGRGRGSRPGSSRRPAASPGVAAVGAQRAAIDADVGGIQVGVDVVIGRVAVLRRRTGRPARPRRGDRPRAKQQLPVGRPTGAGRIRPCADLGDCGSCAWSSCQFAGLSSDWHEA